MNTFKELENYYKSKSYLTYHAANEHEQLLLFYPNYKRQRYTSYIKVMTLSGLTLVALKEAMMKSSVFHFMTAAITILIK